MTSKFSAVLLFGCPGSGKGTQGKVLGSLPGFVHLAMGDILRALDKNSDLGRETASFTSRGHLVPDVLTIRIWKEHIEGLIAAGKYDPKGHLLVLDGIPRTPAQAADMDPILEVHRILHLMVPDREALFARLRSRALQQGRKDDADEAVIRHRYDTYETETRKTLTAYQPAKVADIDATGSPLEVAHSILSDLVEHVPMAQKLKIG